jgi:hypothetical protein
MTAPPKLLTSPVDEDETNIFQVSYIILKTEVQATEVTENTERDVAYPYFVASPKG